MASKYFPARGCVYRVNLGESSSLIALNPALTGSAVSPIILESANVTQKDLVVPKPTLGRTKILYSFGEDFGDVQVRGVILLGEAGQGLSGFAPVTAYFNSHRTSVTNAPIGVSVGSAAFEFYLTNLVVGDVDPQFNLQRFILAGVQV